MGADTIVHLGRAYVHTHTYATVCRRTFSSACSNIGERAVCGSLYIQNVDVALSLARAAAVDVAPSQALAMTDCYKALAHAEDHFRVSRYTSMLYYRCNHTSSWYYSQIRSTFDMGPYSVQPWAVQLSNDRSLSTG